MFSVVKFSTTNPPGSAGETGLDGALVFSGQQPIQAVVARLYGVEKKEKPRFSGAVSTFRSAKNGGRHWTRTSDPYRVKVVL